MSDPALLILTALGILGWAVALRVLWAVREGVGWVMKATVIGALAFVAAQAVLFKLGRSNFELMAGGYVCAGLAVALTPKRRRYIPSKVRKRVIARDLKGEKFDGRKHHIDHIWPHSKGGSNTADNLRVIPKEKNLKKGARKPGLKDWL